MKARKNPYAPSPEDAAERLREAFPPGSTVHTILRNVSRSGMRRSISLMTVDADGISEASWYAAIVLDESVDQDRGGIIVGGAGMDMGYWLVYRLSRALYRDGFECVGERCPSNDHSNGDREYAPHHHADGGYALHHRWI